MHHFSDHSCDEINRRLFQKISIETSATIQGGWWSHYSNVTQIVSEQYYLSGSSYSGPTQAFRPPTISPSKETTSTYSYGYGTDF